MGTLAYLPPELFRTSPRTPPPPTSTRSAW